MEQFLREWRQDALNKHQYECAIFIGDKVLALSNDDQDAFWLAQVHFSTGNYTRARSFLQREDLIATVPSCRYLAALCFIKQQKFEDALDVLGDRNPTHLIRTQGSARKKLHQVHTRLQNGVVKQSGVGEPSKGRVSRSEELDSNEISNIRFEAAMCYLRGVCFAKLNAFDRAKQCYKDAVRIDVQCFEAFDQLMKNSLMTPDEEWEFLESLDFDSVTAGGSSAGNASTSQEAAQFTKMLYTTRLSKYERPQEFTSATETLSTHYNLSSNPDILLARADLLFTQCRFRDALALTTSILSHDRYNFSALPIHLACLHELNEKNALFLLSHDLSDNHPDEAVSWLAIGVYYLTIHRVADARRFFSKASMMNPHFGAAWIGFAHTFAAEGEHDQAISAYSTAARLFQGTHLPQLFLGMQNIQLQNFPLAHEYLNSAYEICKTDPLLLNELGVVFFHESHLEAALNIFGQAITMAQQTGSDPRAWTATRANMGHAHRRLSQFPEALECFEDVLRQGGRDAAVFCAKSLTLLEMGDAWAAVVCCHEALAVAPQDAVATELLNKALEATEVTTLEIEESEEDGVERRLAGARAITRASRRRPPPGGKGKSVVRGAQTGVVELEGESMLVDDDDE
ncbi:cell division cycle protein-like protein [Rhizodiscina lignyota]|uniref:Cell division cycle protein-like protein n=1 Tax=Rhizodiscina lignyota TaxID=1504668 RepID=A0A9P4I8P5_9PEZI|nr:cell division cycle protein-like protein [Rhizodiscina lignyota]